jgi:hypothetical protein
MRIAGFVGSGVVVGVGWGYGNGGGGGGRWDEGARGPSPEIAEGVEGRGASLPVCAGGWWS